MRLFYCSVCQRYSTKAIAAVTLDCAVEIPLNGDYFEALLFDEEPYIVKTRRVQNFRHTVGNSVHSLTVIALSTNDCPHYQDSSYVIAGTCTLCMKREH